MIAAGRTRRRERWSVRVARRRPVGEMSARGLLLLVAGGLVVAAAAWGLVMLVEAIVRSGSW